VLALLGLTLRMYLQYRPRRVTEAPRESEDSGGFPETSLSPSGT
jgi:hypothetical protein